MHKRKNMIFISNRGFCRVLWFLIGQGVQLVLHGISQNFWEYRQIPFCIAGGFFVFFFLFAGMWITAREAESDRTHSDYFGEHL